MKLTLDELQVIISCVEMYIGDGEEVDEVLERLEMELKDRIGEDG